MRGASFRDQAGVDVAVADVEAMLDLDETLFVECERSRTRVADLLKPRRDLPLANSGLGIVFDKTGEGLVPHAPGRSMQLVWWAPRLRSANEATMTGARP